VAGVHIIIVEDIVDSGNTLSYLYNTLKERQAASVKTCALIEKKRDKLYMPLALYRHSDS